MNGDNLRLIVEAVLIVALMVGAYFKVIPTDVLIAVISAFIGHSVTITGQNFVSKKIGAFTSGKI